MEFLDKNLFHLSFRTLKIKKKGSKLVITNISNKHSICLLPKIFFTRSHKVLISFQGKEIKGEGSKIVLLNRKKETLLTTSINYTTYSLSLGGRMFIAVLVVPPQSIIEIKRLNIDCDFDEAKEYNQFFKGDTLLVTPVYPSIENRYSGGFVHTRAKAYIKSNIKLDVALINNTKDISIYSYEGVKVFQGNYFSLRQLLQQKKYKRILIHFFSPEYANVLDSCDLDGTQLFFYLHGAETLYWDWNKMATPYFQTVDLLSSQQVEDFRYKDSVIKKYNENNNVTWVFVTPWTRKRSEELINIKYNKSVCIPCWIDEKLFKEEEKNAELRKKIFVLRKFENINTYSIDIVVRTILELSRRDFFTQLEFNIYGDGSLFDLLLDPVKKFQNVKLHKTFLTHKEIREVHQAHGIALFPTRFDSQAVSSCEAASSGCVVISSINPGVEQYILPKYGTLCEPENYLEYANLIEKLFYDKELFRYINKNMYKNIREKCSYRETIQKELKMFKESRYLEPRYLAYKGEPILTVIIPSYNVEKYLRHTIFSILNQKNRNKIEVLIINDGSKDSTEMIGKDLENHYNRAGRILVRLINKENGGHGSTINVGIREARGKYLKVVDGDDTVDSADFGKLIDLLENESVDIVLTDYIEDYARDGVRNVKKLYNFMSPGIEYTFDDLCYPGYGFDKFGPILSTSTYKTEMLRKAGFSLSEKMFYVDMELNVYVALCTQTIKYFPLTVYRYLLGNQGQSISRQSFTKNYKHHENVTIKMLDILYSEKEVSEQKARYIRDNLIIPMINTQYYIVTKYVKTMKAFNSFDSRLKKYKDFYYDNRVATKNINFHRKSKALFIRFEKI